ncbi:MAG: radical SAM protein [Theionarchaea archaeon]|nr:radical SAM protein [Theionarchaea archaeon]
MNEYSRFQDNVYPPMFFTEEVTFLFHITDWCNLTCNHCFINAGSSPVHQFSLGEVSSILADMRRLKVSHVAFSGGEPTMHKEFIQILETAHTEGFNPDFVSNGTLLTEELSRNVKDLVRCILISIDGPEEYHDAFRGKKGAFRKTMIGIAMLRKFEIPFALQFTVTKKSLPFIEWIAETSSQLGAECVKLEPLVTGGRARKIAHLCLNEKEIDQLAELSTKLYGKYMSTTSIYIGVSSRQVLTEHPCNAYACFGSDCHRHAANEPRQVVILPNGDVSPLDTDLNPLYYMGNVNEKSLYDIITEWFGSHRQERFLELCRKVFKEKVLPYPYEAIPWSQIVGEESWKTEDK